MPSTSFPEARALFDKALALDRARVEREPGRYMYRLDLSFSLGSIGALLQAQGDLEGAYVHYQQAVELRKAVVESEPTDEFARGSLARGYDRLALIEGRRGRLSHALEWHDRRVQLYLAELKAHPERDGAWRDYAQTAFGSVSTFLDLMDAQKGRSQLGRAHRARLAEMLETLVATRSRWVTERRSGELPPSDADMRRAAERLQRLRH
jgi:tetratricopeptide (TPR) repeat protein